MFQDCLLVVLASLCSTLLAEAISWVLVYRTQDYQSLKARVEQLTAKIQRKKDTTTATSSKKSKDKRIAQYEQNLQSVNKELSFSKMKSMLAVGFVMISLMGVLNNHFSGRVIARLPFEPLPLIRSIAHRGLEGNDFTECGMIFLYILCGISFRGNIQKLLGTAPPKGIPGSSPSIFGQ